MKIQKHLTIALMVILTMTCSVAQGGPALGAICSAGCASLVVACYCAAGAVFGTVTAGAATPATILACNAAFGKCMAACAATYVAPTP